MFSPNCPLTGLIIPIEIKNIECLLDEKIEGRDN
uniref:Uncharacterized protein n=1 Tax=Lepeophtheirus salmonis TaxID=72036 RepID=A0A0K2T9L2_LEPSM